jgi:GT2 family glycosyltransferase
VQAYGGRWRAPLARAVALGQGRELAAPVAAAEIEAAQSYVSGASMLLNRRFRDQVGPMREDYFLYGEEVEWCLRARAMGLRLGFAPGARVLHHAGSTTGSHDRTKNQPRTPVYLDERNKLLITRDRFPALLPVVIPATLGLLILRFGKRRAWRQLGYALQGWAAGLMGRRGPPSWIETGLA